MAQQLGTTHFPTTDHFRLADELTWQTAGPSRVSQRLKVSLFPPRSHRAPRGQILILSKDAKKSCFRAVFRANNNNNDTRRLLLSSSPKWARHLFSEGGTLVKTLIYKRRHSFRCDRF